MSTDPVELVLARLREKGCDPRTSGDGFTARCPAHEDKNPSFQLRRGDNGGAVVKCFSGCTPKSIVHALGIQLRDLFAADGAGSERRGSAPKRQAKPARDWAALADKWMCSVVYVQHVDPLAAKLGVSAQSLIYMRIGWVEEKEIREILGKAPKTAGGAWTFPMWDGAGQVVGVCLRGRDGAKWSLPGSRQGLFLPRGFHERSDPVLIVEGASDVAAAIDAGYNAVGRPSANAGADFLIELCRGRKCVILAERDEKPYGKWPGLDGARAIAKKLHAAWGVKVPVFIPPVGSKDLRAFLASRKAVPHE